MCINLCIYSNTQRPCPNGHQPLLSQATLKWLLNHFICLRCPQRYISNIWLEMHKNRTFNKATEICQTDLIFVSIFLDVLIISAKQAS